MKILNTAIVTIALFCALGIINLRKELTSKADELIQKTIELNQKEQELNYWIERDYKGELLPVNKVYDCYPNADKTKDICVIDADFDY